MPREPIEFLSAVLIVSADPQRLATFYRDLLGLPLVDERHGETLPHYGCELGDLHFAIHPIENFEGAAAGVGAVKLAFTVFDLAATARAVREAGAELLYEPRDAGFAKMTALRDPDGNLVELTELSAGWFKHLEERRSQGHDVVARWKSRPV